MSLSQKKYLLPEERDRLEYILDRYKDSDFRDTTLIWTLLYTGARGAEVLKIRKSDLCGNLIYITGCKGSKDREIPVPTWLLDRLRVLCPNLADDDFIFRIVPGTLRRIWRMYRPVKKGSHCMRHSFAINLYKNSKDPKLVKKALGHSWLSTTEIYLTYDYSAEEMRTALGY